MVHVSTKTFNELIHEADPQSLFSHVLPGLSVTIFENFAKQNNFKVRIVIAKIMFATGETVGLAEWIIDGIVLNNFFCSIKSVYLLM